MDKVRKPNISVYKIRYFGNPRLCSEDRCRLLDIWTRKYMHNLTILGRSLTFA
jgi:hypothetical protein